MSQVGEHDFEAELTREAREQAERDHEAAACGVGWWDGKEGHICRQEKGHAPPHQCTLNKTCRAQYAG